MTLIWDYDSNGIPFQRAQRELRPCMICQQPTEVEADETQGLPHLCEDCCINLLTGKKQP